MQELARGGYSSEEIRDMLHGKHGSRVVNFRYDLLDKDENKKGELSRVVSGEVSMSAFANIKRTAKITLEEEGQVNKVAEKKATWNDFAGKTWNDLANKK